MVKFKFYIFILLICCATALQAQNRSAFDSLVTALEKVHPYTFYYDKKLTDGLKVGSVTGPLEQVLKIVLEGSGLHYYISDGAKIYISRYPLQNLRLPADFFTSSRPIKDTVPAELQEPVVEATIDNKIYTIGVKGTPGSAAILSGYVRDAKSGEPIVAASVTIEGTRSGVSTDAFGFYSITLPKGRQVVKVSTVGMKEVIRQLSMQGNGRMDLEMREEVRSLKTAVVMAQKNSNVRGMQMGVERLNIKVIRSIPAIFGETDILRSLLTLPGVTSVGEGTVGYNVRGGAADQNLVLLNDMTLYNPTHVFGLFSAVDPEVIRGLELYKSAIPERMGGRISSIMDISTKDGNSKQLTGSVGLGPVTSRFTMEGPLGSEKSTFLIGGRGTYSNWLLKSIPQSEFNNSAASFFDIILHVTQQFSEKDRVYLSAYASNDKFRLRADSTFAYTNRNIRLKWRHDFSDKFYNVLSAGYDGFNYSVTGRSNPRDAFDLRFGIGQLSARSDFKFTPNNVHEVSFGLQHIAYDLRPGEQLPYDNASLIKGKIIPKEKATETAVYIGDQFKLSDVFSIQGGVRYAYFRNLGPKTGYIYANGSPRSEFNVIDSVKYGNGELVKAYQAPEWRFSLRILATPRISFKVSYNTLQQFIHVITNSTAISPTDIWKLSDNYIKPQQGQQLSVGFYAQPGKKSFELSVEVYYKTLRHYLDYKSGAKLVLNPTLERDVINTNGKAYGVEFFIKKPLGKLNGWLSYTYLRSFLKQDDALAGEVINKNEFYPANFDKPHIANLVLNYKFTQRYSLSVSSTYSTGRPITIPVGVFNMGGAQRVYYSDRNAYRIPDFFRTDMSLNIENGHRLKQKVHSSWTLGVYNIAGRDNPYSVYFTLEDGKIKGYQLSVFATAIPFLSFNLKF